MSSRFIQFVDIVLFGSAFAVCQANRKVQSKIDDCSFESFNDDPRLAHSEETLEGFLATSIDRVQRVEGKAMSTLLGVGVAVAVIGATSGLLGPGGELEGHSVWMRIASAVLLVGALAYLLGSSLMALQAYKIGAVYSPTLADCDPLVESGMHKQIMLYCIEQNHRVGTLRTNRLFASFSCLRNGLAAVCIIGILMVLVALFS